MHHHYHQIDWISLHHLHHYHQNHKWFNFFAAAGLSGCTFPFLLASIVTIPYFPGIHKVKFDFAFVQYVFQIDFIILMLFQHQMKSREASSNNTFFSAFAVCHLLGNDNITLTILGNGIIIHISTTNKWHLHNLINIQTMTLTKTESITNIPIPRYDQRLLEPSPLWVP